MNKRGPAYWRRLARRGQVPHDHPKVIAAYAAIPAPRKPTLDEQLAALDRPTEPRRHR